MTVNGSATGNIATANDKDWWAIDLGTGTYQIDLQGEQSSSGTLADPKISGIHNSVGTKLTDTDNDNGQGLTHDLESRVVYSTNSSGIRYISVASADGPGTYTLTVTDITQ